MLSAEWIAGFFDGEGSVGIYTSGRRCPYLKAQIVQCDTALTRAVLLELQTRFAGSISHAPARKRMGSFVWQVSSGPAAQFLHFIRPHLHLKGEQADVALEWYISTLCGCPQRDSRGRIVPACCHKMTTEAAGRLKELKRVRD